MFNKVFNKWIKDVLLLLKMALKYQNLSIIVATGGTGGYGKWNKLEGVILCHWTDVEQWN